MVIRTSAISDLQPIVGKEHVRPGGAEEAVDGVVPRAAVSPGTYEEVAAVLRYANDSGLAVVPRCGGTMMHIGNIPVQYDLALSLSRLDGVVEHEPADLTATVQAGMTLGELRKHLASFGQMVPLDPSLPDRASVGGVLATNAFGPSRHAYGTARDFTIGMRVATADGRLTRAGGRVVKNVAGYDMCKLYIGSLGTLGVIVEATFKLAPLPKAQATADFAFSAADRACAATSEMQSRGLSVRGIRLVSAASGCVLALEFAGTAAGVERSVAEARHIARERGGGRETDAPAEETVGEGELVCRLGVPPGSVPQVMTAIERELPGVIIEAYPTSGVLTARGGTPNAVEAIGRVRRAAAEAGGWAVVESCPPAVKREIDVFGEATPGFELMRRVKAEFDPKGTLSPGRFVGKL